MEIFRKLTESEFYGWSKNGFQYAISSENLTKWRVASDAVSEELLTSYQNYDADYLRATNPETRTSASIAAKNKSKTVFKTNLRKYFKGYIIYNPRVTDEDRKIMNLSLYDTKPSKRPAPSKEPILEVRFAQKQEHSLSAKNSEGGRRKEQYATGWEIWRKTGGDAPASDSDFTYVGISTRSPFIIKYGLEDAGKMVWYRIRWINAKNEPGPWSEIVSAIIP
jgi:hypothetical protein